MQKCEVCNFAGNPPDAKYCIECAKPLPIKAYTGATSRLAYKVPWSSQTVFNVMMSGVLPDPPLQIFYSSGEYHTPIGKVDGDKIYLTRDEYRQIMSDIHTFQYIDTSNLVKSKYYGYEIVII